MKVTYYVASLCALLTACGASPTPAPVAATPAATNGAAAMNPPAAMSNAPSASQPTTNAPAVASSASSGDSAAANSSPSNAPASAGAAGTGKGTLSGSITLTPAAAVKSAVVYLEDGPEDKAVTGSMDNRQMTFVPHVLVVTAGAKVTFSNSDPFPHNVFSPDNEKWDLGMIPAHAVRVRKFDKPGVYTVLCNIHPNMKAYILVVPSSHFAKADKNGAYSMSDVPAGKYKLAVWAPGVKLEEQEVTIDGDKALSFELHK